MLVRIFIVSAAGGLSSLFIFFICLDNRLYNPVPYNILFREKYKIYALYTIEDLYNLREARGLSSGQVDLGDVAGYHSLGVESKPCEEHLHLLHGGVLRLIEDDE